MNETEKNWAHNTTSVKEEHTLSTSTDGRWCTAPEGILSTATEDTLFAVRNKQPPTAIADLQHSAKEDLQHSAKEDLLSTSDLPSPEREDMPLSNLDTQDGITHFELTVGVVSIVLYLVDMGSDIKMATFYFLRGELVYGALTTAFIVVTYIVLFIFGLICYFQNEVEDTNMTRGWKFCRMLFLFLGLSPVIM
ncbi:hypothetical protein BaRGS_00002992 [Batillaria attramentaria]|uniref:XK-related protein n=1 Tax=Batillaria attramentaria TaxID=370345 RepID=A0ABD0M1W4_9CAEN